MYRVQIGGKGMITKFEKCVIAVMMAAMMCVPAAGMSAVTVQAEEAGTVQTAGQQDNGTGLTGGQQLQPGTTAEAENPSQETAQGTVSDDLSQKPETGKSEEAQEQAGNDLSDGVFIPLEDDEDAQEDNGAADKDTEEDAASAPVQDEKEDDELQNAEKDAAQTDKEQTVQEQQSKVYADAAGTAGTITVGGDNAPVKMTTEVPENDSVKYLIKAEETGKYYFNIREEGRYDLFEITENGEEWYCGNSSWDVGIQDSMDLKGGKEYCLYIMRDYDSSAETVEWEIGEAPEAAEGENVTEIFAEGAQVYYRINPKDDGIYYLEWDDTQIDLELLRGEEIYYPGTSGVLFKVDPSQENYISIRYSDYGTTGTTTWKLTKPDIPEISTGEEIHTVISADGMPPVYKFTAPGTGRYEASYSGARFYDENWTDLWSDYEEGAKNLTAGQTCYIIFDTYWDEETDWSVNKLVETTIKTDTIYRVAAGDSVYFKFVPPESGAYEIEDLYLNVYDSDWNMIWDYDLTAGQTYYLQPSNGRSKFYFKVNKYQEPEVEKISLEAGKSYVTGENQAVEYTFTPSETGRYRFWSENKANIDIFDIASEESYSGYGFDYWINLEKGRTYQVEIVSNYDSDAEIRWNIAKAGLVTVKKETDYTTEDTKTEEYAFVPDVSGYYLLEYADIGFCQIYDSSWEELYTPGKVYSYRQIDGFGLSVYLESGKTYYFNIRPADGKATWQITLVQSSGDYWYRTLTDGTAEILKYTGGSTSVQVPETIGGKSVKSIGAGAFGRNSDLESVSIPQSVTALQYGAFDSCSSLKKVDFASGSQLQSVADYAFNSCGSLTDINLPGSVETIGDHGFYWCESLADIDLGDNLTEIGDYAFSFGGLTEVNIPDGVEEIGQSCFSSSDSLQKLTIGTGLSGIPDMAFANCEKLTAVEFPVNITYIGVSAFNETGLTEVDIPDTVTSLGDSAFANCKSLQTVNIGSGVSYIAIGAFASCDLQTVTIEGNVETIGAYAFSSNENLASVDLPNTVTEIEYGAFRTCGNLMDIEIPDAVEAIGGSVFDSLNYGGTAWYDDQPDGVVYAGNVLYKYKGEMPAGTTVEVKDGTKGIAGYAFDFQYNLKDITIPNTVTNIGEYAIYGSELLTEIHIPQSVSEIGQYALGYLDARNDLKVPGFTIYGVAGTVAETYAKENGFKFVAEEPAYELGDVDGDGDVGISDLRLVLRSVCRKVTLTAMQELSADVMKDGKVDIQDLRKILRYVCGKIDSFE